MKHYYAVAGLPRVCRETMYLVCLFWSGNTHTHTGALLLCMTHMKRLLNVDGAQSFISATQPSKWLISFWAWLDAAFHKTGKTTWKNLGGFLLFAVDIFYYYIKLQLCWKAGCTKQTGCLWKLYLWAMWLGKVKPLAWGLWFMLHQINQCRSRVIWLQTIKEQRNQPPLKNPSCSWEDIVLPQKGRTFLSVSHVPTFVGTAWLWVRGLLTDNIREMAGRARIYLVIISSDLFCILSYTSSVA